MEFQVGELIIDHQLQRVRRELLYRETRLRPRMPRYRYRTLWLPRCGFRREEQDKARIEAGEAWQHVESGPDLVFTGRYGTAVDPRTLNSMFSARCQAAGVRRLTVHDARRTCATLLVDLDVHPRVIMRVLRHADQAVTMKIYAKAQLGSHARGAGSAGESLN